MVHQSVFELVHSEDREELQRQLHWNSFLTPDQATIPLQVTIINITMMIITIILISFLYYLWFSGDPFTGEFPPLRKIIHRPFSMPFRQHIRVPGRPLLSLPYHDLTISHFAAVRHPGEDQAAARSEPKDGGASPRPLLHLHPLRPSQPARDAPEGGKLLLFLPPGDFSTHQPFVSAHPHCFLT